MTVGLTVTFWPVKPPGFQLYVEAPAPVKVTGEPVQTFVASEVAETVGNGFIIKPAAVEVA